jgi:hypothetical protein
VLLRTLVAEHLGCAPHEVPEDPTMLFDAMVRCADALDAWYAEGEVDRRHGVRGLLSTRLRLSPRWSGRLVRSLPRRLPAHTRLSARAVRRAARLTDSLGAGRPPGRLRRLAVPELTPAELRWAPLLYDRMFDPAGGGEDLTQAPPGGG